MKFKYNKKTVVIFIKTLYNIQKCTVNTKIILEICSYSDKK